MVDRILRCAPLVLGLGFLALLVAAQPDRALKGHNDFVQLYAGAQLVGTPDLYSREANLRQIQATHGFTMDTVVYTRPPFYAVLLRPLALLPYPVAYGCFSLVSFLSIVWFVWRFQDEAKALPILAAMGMPLMVTLVAGQDAGLLLGVLGGVILLLRQGRDFWAGVLICLLGIKFHLFVFLPLAFLLRQRWLVLAGGGCGVLALVLLGGLSPLVAYLAVLRDPWIHFSARHMPNLHGLAANLGGAWWLEVLLIAATLALFVRLARSQAPFELVLGSSLVCGLLTSYHSGIADDAVLYAAVVLILGSTRDRWVTGWMTLMMTPVPFVLVLIGPPWSVSLALMLLTLLALMARRAVLESKHVGA